MTIDIDLYESTNLSGQVTSVSPVVRCNMQVGDAYDYDYMNDFIQKLSEMLNLNLNNAIKMKKGAN